MVRKNLESVLKFDVVLEDIFLES